MANNYRPDRMSELIREELSRILREEVRHPGIQADKLSIISVVTSRDLSHATIKVSVYGDDADKKEAMKALKSATGFIRRALGQVVNTRIVPELHFELDDSIEYAIHIAEVMRSISPDKPEDENGDETTR